MRSSTSFLKMMGAGLINVIFFILTFLLVFALAAVIFPEAETTMTPARYELVTGVVGVLALLIGFWFGQHRIIIWTLGRSLMGWGLVTILSYAGVLILLAGFPTDGNPLFSLNVSVTIVMFLTYSLLLLIFTIPSLLQWLLLRRSFHGAWRWVVVNTIAWLILWAIALFLALQEVPDFTIGLSLLGCVVMAVFMLGGGLAWVVGFPQKGKAKEKRKALDAAVAVDHADDDFWDTLNKNDTL